MQTLKFTEPTGNEQSGHTEGLKNFKDYLQKSAKIPQQLSKSKSRKFGKVVDLISRLPWVGREMLKSIFDEISLKPQFTENCQDLEAAGSCFFTFGN